MLPFRANSKNYLIQAKYSIYFILPNDLPSSLHADCHISMAWLQPGLPWCSWIPSLSCTCSRLLPRCVFPVALSRVTSHFVSLATETESSRIFFPDTSMRPKTGRKEVDLISVAHRQAPPAYLPPILCHHLSSS